MHEEGVMLSLFSFRSCDIMIKVFRPEWEMFRKKLHRGFLLLDQKKWDEIPLYHANSSSKSCRNFVIDRSEMEYDSVKNKAVDCF